MTDMDAILNDVFRRVMPRIKAQIRPRDEAEPPPPPAAPPRRKYDGLFDIEGSR